MERKFGVRIMTGAQLEATRNLALSRGMYATADMCIRELHRRWHKVEVAA